MPVSQCYVVFGADGYEPSAEALRWAASHARIIRARLDAVIAWQYPIAAEGLGFAPAPRIDDTDYGVVVVRARERNDLARTAV